MTVVICLLLSCFLMSTSPFVGRPSRGAMPHSQTRVSLPSDLQAASSDNLAGDHVMHVAPSNIGGTSALSTTPRNQLPSQKQNDIKDEYVLNFDQTVETLTDDYFEYEQGQAEIIVRR